MQINPREEGEKKKMNPGVEIKSIHFSRQLQITVIRPLSLWSPKIYQSVADLCRKKKKEREEKKKKLSTKSKIVNNSL